MPRSPLQGFQPTYKELKLLNNAFSCSIELCFQPTYKELKLVIGIENVCRKWGFQPTYKELKRWHKNIFERRGRRVFSLPIRNWNYKDSKCIDIDCYCFQPTYKELKLIWNGKGIRAEIVFSLPIRNWNFFYRLWWYTICCLFSAYL